MAENCVKRKSFPTTKVLIEILDDAKSEFSKLLKYNLLDIPNADELKRYSTALKCARQRYVEVSREYSSSLIKNGALQEVSELKFERQELKAECQENINVINRLLSQFDEEEISNLDSISNVSSITHAEKLDIYETPKVSVDNKVASFLLNNDQTHASSVDSQNMSYEYKLPSHDNRNVPNSFLRMNTISESLPEVSQTSQTEPINVNPISSVQNEYEENVIPKLKFSNNNYTPNTNSNRIPNTETVFGAPTSNYSNYKPFVNPGKPSVRFNPNISTVGSQYYQPQTVYAPINTTNNNSQDLFHKHMITNNLINTAIPLFDGSAHKFWSWIEQIRSRTASVQLSHFEYLQILESNCTGAPKKMLNDFISSTRSLNQNSFDYIWNTFIDRFGSNHKIAQQLLKQIDMFPSVRGNNMGKQLEELHDLCKIVEYNCGNSSELQILNTAIGLRPLREKLPKFIQDRWRSFGQSYEEGSGGIHPPFRVFLEFIRKLSNELSNSHYDDCLHYEKKSARALITKEENVKPKSNEIECFCVIHNSKNHDTKDCWSFAKLNYADRKKKVYEFKLCFLCLKPHLMADCKSDVKCEKCDKRHCTVMHRDTDNKVIKASTPKDDTNQSLFTALYGSKGTTKSCSKTVLIKMTMENIPNKELLCYAIVDEQSDCCLIDPKVVEFFGKSFPEGDFNLSTVNGTSNVNKCLIVSGLSVQGVREDVKINIPPAFTNINIPDTKAEVATPSIVAAHKNISRFSTAFLELEPTAEVLILIGRNCSEAMKTRCYGNSAPFVHHTALGWALVGETCIINNSKNDKHCNTVLKTTMYHEHYKIKRDFPNNINDVNIVRDVFKEHSDDEQDCYSINEEKFLHIMYSSVTTSEQGNIMVDMPFDGKTTLPNNHQAVYYRTKNTLSKLKLKADKLKDCTEIIKKDLAAGHIEVVPQNEKIIEEGKGWWLPLFPVVHPTKAKTRLVYDASAKYDGVSLNDTLLSGPDCNNQLREVLLRFREERVGIVADIQHMFSNFKVPKGQKDFLRFYWFNNNDPQESIVQYRSTSHIFGSTSSPAVANFCLKYAASQASKSNELGKSFLNDSFYVDDGITSTETPSEAISTLNQAISILKLYNVRLHKISSNNKEVLSSFPESERAEGWQHLENVGLPTQRTLGIQWEAEKDVFVIDVKIPNREFTKRGVLSVINSLYDPLGFVAPVALAGRLLQRTFLPPKGKGDPNVKKCDWDDVLPDEYLASWESWKASLSQLSSIAVPRCIIPNDFIEPKREMHVFADASDNAIGYAIYLKSIANDNKIHVSLVTGGSKVAPRSATSIPRMELCAAVEAVTTASSVLNILKYKPCDTFFYSDSSIVLGYIGNLDKRFSRYVTRRVRIIQKHSTVEQWQYINTSDNPADIASRPHTPKELNKSFWFQGPAMLWEKKNTMTRPPDLFDELPEEINNSKVLHISSTPTINEVSKMCERVNQWFKVLNVCKLIIKLTKIVHKTYDPSHEISYDVAKKFLVKICQDESFHEIKQVLSKDRTLSESHSLSDLSPFIDSDGILRVGGRLHHASISSDQKHPMLLPECHPITNLIVNYYHSQVKHQGRHLTHGIIRQNGFHIINGPKTIRNMIKNCTLCRKLRANVMSQQMSDLPQDRLEEVSPFTNAGLDVFGPYFVHDGKTTRRTVATKKVWVLIIVCSVSRAIHMELLPSMDTASFRNALQRFIAIRGSCSTLRSDNGSNFVAAKKQMDASNECINIDLIQQELLTKNCRWIFNPPAASHCGGAWERKIGSVKRILEGSISLLKTRQLSRDEFSTLIQESAAIVNNTPLWEISSSPDDPFPLCPANLLTLKESCNPPSLDTFTEADLLSYGKARWRRCQYLTEQFWVRWRENYIQTLQYRKKWKYPKTSIEKGDIVLIRNKCEKRNVWPMARVEDVVLSKDGLVRSATLAVAGKNPSSKRLYRSIHDLVLIVKHNE